MAQSNEQDDELRHHVHMKMLSKSTNAKEAGQSTVVLLGFAVDMALELIKQHELEARLDEAEKFLAYDLFGTLQRIERTNDAVNRRIGELKAERRYDGTK